jgi:hypothetical protein
MLENKKSKLKIQKGGSQSEKAKLEIERIKLQLLSTFLIFDFQLNVKFRSQ